MVLFLFITPVQSAERAVGAVSSQSHYPVRFAVAANFTQTLRQLAQQYQSAHGTFSFRISTASSGTLYTQIINGAPFDLFFSADTLRPEHLIRAGKSLSQKPYIYARGQLVLWAPGKDIRRGLVSLTRYKGKIAIANPKLAPYGLAAKKLLEKVRFWLILSSRLIQGNNIAQTFQYVASGAAQAGFVARSQLQLWLHKQGRTSNIKQMQDVWIPSVSDYPAISQGVVLLPGSEHNSNVKAFLIFLKSPQAKHLVREAGYLIP